jgi:hypothetical protein
VVRAIAAIRITGNFKTVNLQHYQDRWAPDDPHGNFKAEVACYTAADPLPAMDNLSRETGIPLGCLVRYVLVKYAASGSEALLAMGPIVFRQMREHLERAEGEGTDEARLRAYTALRDMIRWLGAAGAD